MDKNKKRTLTISSNLKKKIDTSSISTSGKKSFSVDKKKVFNTRGKSFKSINVDTNSLSREEIIQLLLSDGKLIKRPFLVYEEKKVILGFNEIEYTTQFL